MVDETYREVTLNMKIDPTVTKKQVLDALKTIKGFQLIAANYTGIIEKKSIDGKDYFNYEDNTLPSDS